MDFCYIINNNKKLKDALEYYCLATPLEFIHFSVDVLLLRNFHAPLIFFLHLNDLYLQVRYRRNL